MLFFYKKLPYPPHPQKEVLKRSLKQFIVLSKMQNPPYVNFVIKYPKFPSFLASALSCIFFHTSSGIIYFPSNIPFCDIRDASLAMLSAFDTLHIYFYIV